jgi:hypothetical protein
MTMKAHRNFNGQTFLWKLNKLLCQKSTVLYGNIQEGNNGEL